MSKRPRIFSWAQFNLARLLQLAEALHGRPCHCDQDQRPMSGAMNWAIKIQFDDDERMEWIFRSPLPRVCPDDIAGALLASEVATIQCIAERTTVPVPTIFAFCAHSDNDIGVPYILQSKATGTSLIDYSIREATGAGPGLTDDQRATIMGQLGAFARQMAQVRFPKIGSLVRDSAQSDYSVGPCLAPAFVWGERHLLDDLDRGPFDSPRGYFDTLAEALSRHAQELGMDYHALLAPLPRDDDYMDREARRFAGRRWNHFVSVRDKIDHSRNRFAYCMAANILRETVVPYLCCADGGSTDASGYPLIHPDLNVGNIFVDDVMNVTCIIDWSSATTAPLLELLAAPRLWGYMEVVPRLFDTYRDAVHAALPTQHRKTNVEKNAHEGRKDDEEEVFWARASTALVFQRLTRFCSSHDYKDFVTCIQRAKAAADKAAAATINTDVVLNLLEEEARRDANKTLLAELQDDDPPPGTADVQDRVGFFDGDRRAETNNLAVARKLTVMWQMNPRFVADARLWTWLLKALGDIKASSDDIQDAKSEDGNAGGRGRTQTTN
ncbi:hypothetical protein SPBR_01596 [Sporothrix brasiliensis 5110]|uniref:Aminoglycoside phosphotransferase domain-containing protein n=1 Tax=Sporothrix brasiliensis 5110 TaxID=1398154 RepID=A0A0C2FJE8_9PEZI|nr:uncharacterized protein SPBR_01596 [Sporothrix brasiliensis 5110]KIH91148.1 hypothetical protein SPBR_01596 [Sporothrix brasiliensis 5110]